MEPKGSIIGTRTLDPLIKRPKTRMSSVYAGLTDKLQQSDNTLSLWLFFRTAHRWLSLDTKHPHRNPAFFCKQWQFHQSLHIGFWKRSNPVGTIPDRTFSFSQHTDRFLSHQICYNIQKYVMICVFEESKKWQNQSQWSEIGSGKFGPIWI